MSNENSNLVEFELEWLDGGEPNQQDFATEQEAREFAATLVDMAERGLADATDLVLCGYTEDGDRVELTA